jgi:hypothetical protein
MQLSVVHSPHTRGTGNSCDDLGGGGGDYGVGGIFRRTRRTRRAVFVSSSRITKTVCCNEQFAAGEGNPNLTTRDPKEHSSRARATLVRVARRSRARAPLSPQVDEHERRVAAPPDVSRLLVE